MKLFLAISSLMFLYGKCSIMSTNRLNGQRNHVRHGQYNDVNGHDNQIDGYDNHIDGNVNAVYGDVNDLNGHDNLVAGYGNHVSGSGNMVQGGGNIVVGHDATDEEKQMVKKKLSNLFAMRGISTKNSVQQQQQQESTFVESQKPERHHNNQAQKEQQRPDTPGQVKGSQAKQEVEEPSEPKSNPNKSGAYVVQGDAGFYYNLADTGEDLLGFDDDLVFEDESAEYTEPEDVLPQVQEEHPVVQQQEPVVQQQDPEQEVYVVNSQQATVSQNTYGNLRKQEVQSVKDTKQQQTQSPKKQETEIPEISSEKPSKRHSKKKKRQSDRLSRYQRGGSLSVQSIDPNVAEQIKQDREGIAQQNYKTANDYVQAYLNSGQASYIIVSEEPQPQVQSSRKVPITFFAGQY